MKDYANLNGLKRFADWVKNIFATKEDLANSKEIYIGSEVPSNDNIQIWYDPDGNSSVKTVVSVNNVMPDDSGNINITMTAQDVGALPSSATAVDSTKLGGKAPEYYIQPRNLLDNSDFSDVVNQRGGVSTGGTWNYCIDRWRAVGTVGQLVWHNTDHVALGAQRGISQAIADKNKHIGKRYTLAACDTTGKRYVLSGVYQGDDQPIYGVAEGLEMRLYSVQEDDNIYYNINNMSMDTSAFVYLAWATLYEGEYTAETLPPYTPKGYAVELAECKRYFERKAIRAITIDQQKLYLKLDYAEKRQDSPTIMVHAEQSYNITEQIAVWNATQNAANGILGEVVTPEEQAYCYGYCDISADL